MRTYYLPDHTPTDNPGTYALAWNMLGSKLASALGEDWVYSGVTADYHVHVTKLEEYRGCDRVAESLFMAPITAGRIIKLWDLTRYTK